MVYLIICTFFEIGMKNDKEKKKYKEKNIGHALIRTTIHVLNWQGKRKEKNIKKNIGHAWIRNTVRWNTRKPIIPLGHRVLYSTLLCFKD